MSDTPRTITYEQADRIVLELGSIRKLLEDQAEERKKAPPPPAQAPASSSRPSYSGGGGGQFAEEPIPQPNPLWDLATAQGHTIHFGKNNGVALGTLGDRSLSFYAKEQPPRLDSSGKPYPPRAVDVDLRNAARTIWHARRGTLAGSTQTATAPTQAAAAPAQRPPATTPDAAADEDVPF